MNAPSGQDHVVKKSKFTEEQIAFAFKQAELAGMTSVWWVALGTALLVGRLLHADSLLGWGGTPMRLLGMGLTLAVLSLGGMACLAMWWR